MSPTQEEELKLRLYNGDLSQLGPADRFLKAVIEIPFAYRRMDVLLFMGALQEESPGLKESFSTIEAACKELRSSRLFLKLLEAVLKTGNRMNDGTYRGGAQAFKLDTLLKLADVKGADGKTTLLHFVIQEIIQSEGMRAARNAASGEVVDEKASKEKSEDDYRALGLQVVESLPNELDDVKKAAVLDVDGLTSSVEGFSFWLGRTRDFLDNEMTAVEDESDKFRQAMEGFVKKAEDDVNWLKSEEKRVRSLVKETTDYFHGNSGKDEGMRLFVIVRDFMGVSERACKEVKQAAEAKKKAQQLAKSKDQASAPQPVFDPRRKMLFPATRGLREADDSCSSDSDD